MHAFKIMSDLHLEFQDGREHEFTVPYDGEDALILSGDVQTGMHLDWWFVDLLKHRDVYYLMGNHEYYHHDLKHRSCTRPLRIIPLVLKPGKMPSYHNDLRGHCHGIPPFLLPPRSVGAHMALHHVASQLPRAKRDPANPASPAHQAQ